MKSPHRAPLRTSVRHEAAHGRVVLISDGSVLYLPAATNPTERSRVRECLRGHCQHWGGRGVLLPQFFCTPSYNSQASCPKMSVLCEVVNLWLMMELQSKLRQISTKRLEHQKLKINDSLPFYSAASTLPKASQHVHWEARKIHGRDLKIKMKVSHAIFSCIVIS